MVDFVRRTYIEYVLPLFPATSYLNVLEMANPYVFAYPDKNYSTGPFSSGFTTDLARLENDPKWPKWDSRLEELWTDARGRNTIIGLVILQEDAKGPSIMGGPFDFEKDVLELARGVVAKEDPGVWYQDKLRDVRRKAGLAG